MSIVFPTAMNIFRIDEDEVDAGFTKCPSLRWFKTCCLDGLKDADDARGKAHSSAFDTTRQTKWWYANSRKELEMFYVWFWVFEFLFGVNFVGFLFSFLLGFFSGGGGRGGLAYKN